MMILLSLQNNSHKDLANSVEFPMVCDPNTVFENLENVKISEFITRKNAGRNCSGNYHF